MSADGFRARGHAMIEWIARYMEEVYQFPVKSQSEPGAVLAQLPDVPPEHGAAGAGGPRGSDEDAPTSTDAGEEIVWDAIMRDMDQIIVPGLTHWQSPGFLAYFPCQASGPAILGEIAAAGLNVNGMSWETSPAATELEMRVMDWMAHALDLPDAFTFGMRGFASAGGGCIQGTASEATLVALLAGKSRVLDRIGTDAATRLTAYASTQAHSSVLKAAMVAGFAHSAADHSRVRFIETDAACAMDAALLRDAMQADMQAGFTPCCVFATVGTTSSGAIDPLGPIAQVIEDTGAKATGTWLHVDAAHLGAVAVCKEHRAALADIDRADSLVFNAHKSLLTNFNCSLMWTRDRASLNAALSVNPEYLRNPSGTASPLDYRDWQIPLGRRFGALKLWFVLRHYGLDGIRAFVRIKVAMNDAFKAKIDADERFECCGGNALLGCFRLSPQPGESPHQTDERTRSLLKRINGDGRVYLTHTVLPPFGTVPARFVIRVSFGATMSEPRHVDLAWEIVDRAASA
jgi:aromatic-L-amino-acid/L-tryptophan decarboxylase